MITDNKPDGELSEGELDQIAGARSVVAKIPSAPGTLVPIPYPNAS